MLGKIGKPIKKVIYWLKMFMVRGEEKNGDWVTTAVWWW
jgi:hypothetical protein